MAKAVEKYWRERPAYWEVRVNSHCFRFETPRG
jgi:hypothetical protein